MIRAANAAPTYGSASISDADATSKSTGADDRLAARDGGDGGTGAALDRDSCVCRRTDAERAESMVSIRRR